MTSSDSYIFVTVIGHNHTEKLTLYQDCGNVLNHVYGSEDIYETHVISGLAYGPHTLLKVFLKLGVSVTDFLTIAPNCH